MRKCPKCKKTVDFEEEDCGWCGAALPRVEADVRPFVMQAHRNVRKWGVQDVETLGLAVSSEAGELAQAILQHKNENGDRDQIRHEAVDLGALCVQVLWLMEAGLVPK